MGSITMPAMFPLKNTHLRIARLSNNSGEPKEGSICEGGNP